MNAGARLSNQLSDAGLCRSTAVETFLDQCIQTPFGIVLRANRVCIAWQQVFFRHGVDQIDHSRGITPLCPGSNGTPRKNCLFDTSSVSARYSRLQSRIPTSLQLSILDIPRNSVRGRCQTTPPQHTMPSRISTTPKTTRLFSRLHTAIMRIILI